MGTSMRASFRRNIGRRGTAYVAILGLCLVVVAIAFGAIAAVRIQARAADTMGDVAEARLYAQAAIEAGRVIIAKDSSWRNDESNGTWIAHQNIGSGYFALDGWNQNPALPLNNSDTDSVVLTGTGVKGRARQKLQVTLTATSTKMTCLDAALTGAGIITFTAATMNATGQIICSNNTVKAQTSSVVNGNVESVNPATGSTYVPPTTKSGITPRTLPDATTIFNLYKGMAQQIAITDLPLSGSTRIISGRLMSPQVNPFPVATGGPTNAKGVYYIDCAGQVIQIYNSRIVGTLVIINPGSASAVQTAVNWAPAVSNYPCLLVSGNMTLKYGTTAFAEGTVNLDPPTTPYNGASDGTASSSQTFPSVIKGLVYVSGTLTTSGSPTASLLMASGVVNTSQTLTLNFDSSYSQNPPPGFGTSSVSMAPNTWNQVVDP